MLRLGCPRAVVKWVGNFYKQLRHLFKAGKVYDVDAWFQRNRGLLQGCPWSTIALAILMSLWSKEVTSATNAQTAVYVDEWLWWGNK